VIDAIAFKFQSGTPWVHLPEKYGSWRGVYNRLRVWAIDGTWERVFTALMARIDVDDTLTAEAPAPVRRRSGASRAPAATDGGAPDARCRATTPERGQRRQRDVAASPAVHRTPRTCVAPTRPTTSATHRIPGKWCKATAVDALTASP
jgi:transposase